MRKSAAWLQDSDDVSVLSRIESPSSVRHHVSVAPGPAWSWRGRQPAQALHLGCRFGPCCRPALYPATASTDACPAVAITLSRTGRRLITVGALLIATIAGAAALLIMEQRAASVAEAQLGTTNLARVLAEQTSNSMQAVDLALREVVGFLATAEVGNPDAVTMVGASRATFDLMVENSKACHRLTRCSCSTRKDR